MITSRAIGRYKASEVGVAVVPKDWKGDGSHYGVLIPHGAGVSGDWAIDNTYRTALKGFCDAGYPCFAADFGGQTTWGSDAAITAMTSGFNWLTAAPPNGIGAKAGKCLLYGGSMGALVALNWARQNVAKVLACAISIPVLDPVDIYTNDKGSYQSSIGTAYGVTFPTALPNQATHCPVSFPADVTGFPIKGWAATDDPIASTNAALQTWVAAVGATAVAASLGAVGHNALGLDPREITNFWDANGGQS